MRHMQWTYDELMGCPDGYVDVIVKESKREAREANARQKRTAR